MRRRSRLPLQHELDDRRFRYRARFEHPPGDGKWNEKATLYDWLDDRVGNGNYAWHPEAWSGYGPHTYLLHFDDYTIIADLLKHYAGIYLKVIEPPRFTGQFTREELHSIRVAIRRLQNYLVERLDTPVKRVVWAFGRAEIPRSFMPGRMDELNLQRINGLSGIDTALSIVPHEGERTEVSISDAQRGALETGFAEWRDMRPAPGINDTSPLFLFLQSLEAD